jgi:large subunit ribosomal protein L18
MATAGKKVAKLRRHRRVRNKVRGVTERPRLAVFRSNTNIYAQVIDDIQGVTLVSASTLDKEIKKDLTSTATKDAAEKVGELLAKRATKKDIKQVVFDRSGYIYHGRIEALAGGARKGGLTF